MDRATDKQHDYILALMRKIYNPYGNSIDDNAIIDKIEERWSVNFFELTSAQARIIINSIKDFREGRPQTRQVRTNYQPRPTPKPACALCGDPEHRMDTCPKNPIYKRTKMNITE